MMQLRRMASHVIKQPQPPPGLKMLITGTSGSIIDKYQLGSVIAFQLSGKTMGLSLTSSDITPFLGKCKRVHIREMMQQLHLLEMFKEKHFRAFDFNQDVAYFYESYLREQLVILHKIPLFSEMLPEFDTMRTTLKQFHPDLLYGVTSTYPWEVMTLILQNVSKNNTFIPDVMRCSAHATRRAEMIEQCLQKCKIAPRNAVFVSCQQTDLDAAKQVGVFAIGVTHTLPQFTNADAVCANMADVGTLLSQNDLI